LLTFEPINLVAQSLIFFARGLNLGSLLFDQIQQKDEGLA
jgi:hypothetical protein